MSNSRRARRTVARHQRQARDLIADAAVRYPDMVAEAVATLDRTEEQVSNRPWSDFSQADYTPAQWRRACLIDTGVGDRDSKERYKLPVREPSGTVNRNGVHAAAARINQVDASADLKRRAARALIRLYRSELDEEPPESLQLLAGQSESTREAVTEIGAVEARRDRPGRMLIQLIKAGWSLNGRYYPAEVLRRDGPSAFPAGTQAFVDHATEEELAERPVGSVRDLAAVMTGPARWDNDRNALMGEVRLFAPWREQLTDMAEHIGMSIRALVMAEPGERDGQTGEIVSELVEGRSVDFVTVPAAGGRIVSVLESAQPKPAEEARNVGAWLESRLHLALTQLGDDMYGDGRLTRAERIALSSAIGDALQAWTARVEADAPQLFERDLFAEPEPPAEQPAEETGTAVPDAAEAADASPDPASEAGPVDPPAADTTPTVEAVHAAPIPVAEMATELHRLDALLGHTTDLPAPAAGTGQTAGGSPPTASTTEKEAPMTETQAGARAPDQAGTASEARETPTPPVEASEAQVAVVTQERDQYRARAHSLAEALTEAQNAQRQAEALRDAAVTEMRRLRANEAGRNTVDRLLAAAESGVPENMQQHISPRVHAAVQDRVPQTDTGEVDTAALESLVASAIRTERVHAAQLLEAQGVGTVQGLGAEGDPTMQMTAEQFERQVSSMFADIGLDESTAQLATKGR